VAFRKGGTVAATATASQEVVEASLGQVVLYHAAERDDAPELAAFPLSSEVQTFAAIVARVHPRGAVDLMVVDPSKGPMPRWKVPFSPVPRPGHWTPRDPSAGV
jgi:hypothetical protein